MGRFRRTQHPSLVVIVTICLVLCGEGVRGISERIGAYDYAGSVEGSCPTDSANLFSTDCLRMVTCKDDDLWIWDVRTLRHVAAQPVRQAVIRQCRLVNKGLTLFTADDNSVKLWDVVSSTLRSARQVGNGEGLDAACSEDGQYVVSLGKRTVAIWMSGAARPDHVIAETQRPVYAAFDPTNKSVVVQVLDDRHPFHLYVVATALELFPLKSDLNLEHRDVPRPVFDAGGRRLIVPQQHGFRIVDVETGRETAAGSVEKGLNTRRAAFAGRDSLVVLTCWSSDHPVTSAVQVFDARSGKLVHHFGSDVLEAALTPDCRLAVVTRLTVDDQECTEVWDVAAEQKVQTLQFGVHKDEWPATLSPDGTSIAQYVEGDRTLIWRRYK